MVDSSTQRPELAKTAGEDPTRRRLTVSGFPVAIEYPAGSTKLGEDDDGKAWARVYLLDYGFIEGGPLGGDGETLDVYVGPSHDALQVFVVNQLKKDGSFDETKCMLGFTSLEDAKRGYLMHYPEGWENDRIGSIKTMGIAAFRRWLGGDGVMKAAARPNPVTNPGAWIDPKGGVHSTEGATHAEWVRNRENTPKATESEAIDHLLDQGWIRLALWGGDTLAQVGQWDADALHRVQAALQAHPNLRGRKFGLGCPGFSVLDAPMDEFLAMNKPQDLRGYRVASGASVTDSPAFKAWFGTSKAVDDAGRPQRFFHGTSKDKNFDKFSEGQRGIWFTKDPEEASAYAKDNDSQNLKYNHDTRRYDHINEQPRVIPVYLKMLNPYVMTPEDTERFTHTQNYAGFQRDLGNKVRAKGYDSIIYPDGSHVVFNASQVKSAIGNKGTFSDADKRITALLFAPARDSRSEVLMTVDVAKVEASYSKDPNLYVGPGGSGAAIGDRYNQFKQWMAENPNTPIGAPSLGFDPRRGICFGNGRHRWAVLRDLGAKRIAVTVDRGSVKDFEQLFGGQVVRGSLAHAAEEVGKEVTAALALQPKLAKAELEQIVLAAPTWKRCSADWDPAYQAQVLKRAALAVDTHLAGRTR